MWVIYLIPLYLSHSILSVLVGEFFKSLSLLIVTSVTNQKDRKSLKKTTIIECDTFLRLIVMR